MFFLVPLALLLPIDCSSAVKPNTAFYDFHEQKIRSFITYKDIELSLSIEEQSIQSYFILVIGPSSPQNM